MSRPPRSSGKRAGRKKQRPKTPGSTDAGRQPERRQSGSAPAETTANRRGTLRLNRYLAAAGFGSRRQCDELIASGRVEIDGETVSQLGVTVDPASNRVEVDGVSLKRQKLVYFAVNKPAGVVTTNSDPQGRPRVIDLVPPGERVFPVGRLDRSSEGLILLTNDGDLAQHLAHPRFGIQKVYRVTVAGRVEPETMRQMRQGIYISDGHVRVEGARVLKSRHKSTEMEIVLREGKNREIRRILARLGHKVQSLRRIAIGPLRLGDTPPGAYRVLTREEVDKLRSSADAAERGGGKPKMKQRKKATRGVKTGRTRQSGERSAQAGRREDAATGDTGSRRRKKPTGSRPSKGPAGGTVIGGDRGSDSDRKRPAKKRDTVKRNRRTPRKKGR